MITNAAVVAPQVQGIHKTAKATIKASARLFNFFADQIYADKYIAIIRELVANAMDAHTVAKNTKRAVEVTLPTTFTPYMVVEDFGTGMSEEFLLGSFMAYTDASTKQDSNELIGGFGIGSKAPLSYTDQFSIKSYQNGEQKIYSLFKDDEGCPAIALLSTATTERANGIEISFPVEQSDIEKFRAAAYQCLVHFDPLPILKNAASQLVAPEYTVKTETWGFRKNETQSRIIQGGVAYPIEEGSVPQRLLEILSFGIDFFVPIGSVNIALSRERLSYDDATIRVITSLVESIRPTIADHINKMFENCGSRWEALKLYQNSIRTGGPSVTLIQQFGSYKGEKLTRVVEPVMSDKVLMAAISDSHYNKTGRNNWSTARASPPFNAWISAIAPKDIEAILIMDTTEKPILRCRNFLENMVKNPSHEGVLIFRNRPETEVNWKEFIKALGDPEVIYLSTIEPAVVTRGPRGVRSEHISAYTSAYVNSRVYQPDLEAGGFYVEMFNFDIRGITDTEIRALDKGDKQLLYFNLGDVEKIKKLPKWVSAKEEVDRQLKEYRKSRPNIKMADAFHNLITEFRVGTSVGVLKRLCEIQNINIPQRGPLAQFKKLYENLKPQLTDAEAYKRKLLKLDSSKQKETIKKLVQAINDKYPELMVLIKSNYGLGSEFTCVYNKLI